MQNQTTAEEKARKQRVTLIQLHTIKPLINKDRDHDIFVNTNNEC
jgi:Flp pilus assembly CpaF family ATPase